MHRAITTAALAAPLALGGCETVERDYAQAVDREQRAEQVIEDALQLPEGTPGREQLIADARAAEADAERIRKAIEAVRRDSLIAKGLDGASDAARGDWFGLIEGVGALIVAAGTYALATRKAAKEAERKVSDLERRRDESREVQGIAPAYARSSRQVASPIARAAERQADDDLAERIARRMRPDVFVGMPSARSYEVPLPPTGVEAN